MRGAIRRNNSASASRSFPEPICRTNSASLSSMSIITSFMCNEEAARYTLHPGIKRGPLYTRRSAHGLRERKLIKEKEQLMDPKEAKTVADFLIPDFENEMQATLRVIQ